LFTLSYSEKRDLMHCVGPMDASALMEY
jgi:hypothetical protein